MTHPLKIYRGKTNTSLSALALVVGTSKGHLSKIENGRLCPSLRLAIRLSDATSGAVKASDFVSTPQSVTGSRHE